MQILRATRPGEKPGPIDSGGVKNGCQAQWWVVRSAPARSRPGDAVMRTLSGKDHHCKRTMASKTMKYGQISENTT